MTKSATTRERTDQAELFAEHREDKVGVLLGQIEELRARGAQSDAEEPAAAERQKRLDDVEAGIERILPWIEEGKDSRAPIRTCEHGDRGKRDHRKHDGRRDERGERPQQRRA